MLLLIWDIWEFYLLIYAISTVLCYIMLDTFDVKNQECDTLVSVYLIVFYFSIKGW